MAFFSLGEDKIEIEPGPLSHWHDDFEYEEPEMNVPKKTKRKKQKTKNNDNKKTN